VQHNKSTNLREHVQGILIGHKEEVRHRGRAREREKERDRQLLWPTNRTTNIHDRWNRWTENTKQKQSKHRRRKL